MCSVVPALALNFALYEDFHMLYAPLSLPASAHALVAGASSGAIASTLLFPVDLLRRQMQMVGLGGRPKVYANVFQAVRHVYETGVRRQPAYESTAVGALLGLREFFRGLMPELLKVAPHSAIMFCIHSELLSRRWLFEYVGV